MAATREDLPENIDALKAVLLVERARAVRVEAELAVAKAKASDDDALIAHQRLQIEKLTRQLYGQHSERTAARAGGRAGTRRLPVLRQRATA
jgi:hypothetical protein